MDERYLSRLHERVRTLVTEIEDFARLEIGVGLNPKPADPNEVNQDYLALDISPTKATILLRDLEDFPDEAVLHELLHLRRFWLDGVPMLYSLFGNPGITMADNALEHLIIVPSESAYGFNPYPYWNDTLDKAWKTFEKIEDPEALRQNSFLGWATTRTIVDDPKVQANAEQIPRRLSLWEDAERVADELLGQVGSKTRMLKTYLRVIGLTPFEVGVRRIDVLNRTSTDVDVFELLT